LDEITELLASYLTCLGVEDIYCSPRSTSEGIFKQNLAMHSSLKILIETTSVFIGPANLMPLQVAKYMTILLLEKQDNVSKYTKRRPRSR